MISCQVFRDGYLSSLGIGCGGGMGDRLSLNTLRNFPQFALVAAADLNTDVRNSETQQATRLYMGVDTAIKNYGLAKSHGATEEKRWS
jgi:hypothetical protein